MTNNDKQELLISNLDLFTFNKDTINVGTLIGLKDLINWAYNKYSPMLTGTTLNNGNVIPVIDNSIQLDGNFFSFCRDQKLEVQSLAIDSITILSTDDNSDPFVMQGCFLIKTNNFSFIKCSLFYKTSDESNQVSSFVLLNSSDYQKYLDLKKQYLDWNEDKDGITIKLIGGDDYYLDNYYNWDDLFFGEKQDIKTEIKNYIDNFKTLENLYKEAKIPWKSVIFITGLPGNGKSELVNTIICETGLKSLTVSCEIDDSVLAATFNFAASKENTLLFIEDIDDFINDEIINVESLPYILDSLDSVNCSNGLIVLITAAKLPENYKDILFKFDKVIELSLPEYDKCVDKLFGRYLSTENLTQLKADCKKNKLSYGYIDLLYKLFAKNVIEVNIDKNKDFFFNEIQKILKYIVKENDLANKKYMKTTKKLGLDSKK